MALVLLMPILVIISQSLSGSDGVWSHLVDTVLADYVLHSLILMAGVSAGTLLLGVPAAWLVARCDFPGRRVFEWALMLPLALPAYIIAYTYTGLLDVGGPVQSGLREWTGWSYGQYWFPEIRSMTGAIAMLSLVLFPYVYLLTRAAFANQSASGRDVSRSLGCSPWASFRRVSLPQARPAIVAGLSLVLMETLADYGTVQYFGISTFTTGIFRTWYGLDSLAGAAQLATSLLGAVILMIIVERFSRRKARYHHHSQDRHDTQRSALSGWRRQAASGWCLSILTMGFFIPLIMLTQWAITSTTPDSLSSFWPLLGNTVMLAALAAVTAVLVALILGFSQRMLNDRTTTAAVQLSSLGYAIPGAVIAVGVTIALGAIDQGLIRLLTHWFDVNPGLLFSGTIVALILAYTVRFMAVALQSIQAGLARITPSMEEAARLSGRRPWSVLTRIHAPLLSGSLITGLILVFVDVMKELPATLILRPYDINTLAVRTFELASDERLAESALPALTIVLAGLLPVILLNHLLGTRSHDRTP